MSKAKGQIRTAHGIRYRHPVPDPYQFKPPDGPWYMRLSIYRGKSSTAQRVCSSKCRGAAPAAGGPAAAPFPRVGEK